MGFCEECLNIENETKCLLCGLTKNLLIKNACKHKICSTCKQFYDEYNSTREFYFSKLQKCKLCMNEGTILCRSEIGEFILCEIHFNQKYYEMKIQSAESVICKINPEEKNFFLIQIQERISILNQISNTISLTTTKIISQLAKVSQDTIKKCLFEIKNFIQLKNSLKKNDTIGIRDYQTLKNPLFPNLADYKPQIQSALNTLKKKISFSAIFENLQDSKFLYFSDNKKLLAIINLSNKSIDTFKASNQFKIGYKGQMIKIGPNQFFAYGGVGEVPVVEAYLIDSVENEIKVTKNAPFSINSGGCVLFKNHVFVFSGYSAGLKFDLKHQYWNPISQFPEQFLLGVSQVLYNKIIVTGNGTEKLLVYNEKSDSFNSFLNVEKGIKLFFKDLLLINRAGVYQVKPTNELVLLRAGLDLGFENMDNSFTAIHKGRLYVLGDGGKLMYFEYQTHELKISKL